MSYATVLATIKAALTMRPAGQKVLVSAHEGAEIAILDYIESKSPTTRTARGTTTANVNFDVTWNIAFSNTNYDFSINGFDSSGNPVEIVLVSKSSTKLVVKTLIAATITAMANPY